MSVAVASLEVRDVSRDDAAELADLLNTIIAQGGTTALEQPFDAARLADAYLDGPTALCCFVAVDGEKGELQGFQTLGRCQDLPADIGDIGTFTRASSKQRGIGSALFAATRTRAQQLGLSALNATIRADNSGGLAFYERLGFVPHGVMAAVPLNDGTPVDRISKRYALTSAERM